MRVNARRGTYELQQWSKLRQTAPDGLSAKQLYNQQQQQRHAQTLTRHPSEQSLSAGRATPKVLARSQQSPGSTTSPIHRPSPQRTLRNDPVYTPYSPVNSADSFDPRVPLDAGFSKGRTTPEPQRGDSPSAHNFRSNSNAAQQHASQLSALQQHIMNLEDRLQAAEFEKEQLLAEKAHWITTLQDENNILVSVLQDARKAKELFLQELDLLHRERMRVKHLNSDSLNHVQEFLSSLPIASADPHSIPVQFRSKAREMHNEICNLLLEIKANQEQVMEFVSRQATFAEHSLLTGNLETSHSYLNDVRDLASARPNNMTAAKEILEHLPEAVLAAVVDLRTAAGLAEEPGQSLNSSTDDPTKSEAFLELEEEITRLGTQNSVLKQKIAGLEALVEDMKSHPSATALTGQPLDHNQINGISAFDALPDDVRSAAWRILSSVVEEELNQHPLASAVPESMVSEASKEISLQLRGLMAKLLVPALTSSRGRIDIQTEISNSLAHPSFQGELLSLVTLFLAYLFKTQVPSHERSAPGSGRSSRRPSRSTLSRENSSNAGGGSSRRPFT